MLLRRATTVLLWGLVYTVVHKLAYALIPSALESATAHTVTTSLWILASAALMVFAAAFLRETSPRSGLLKGSLYCVMVCTAIVILTKLPHPMLSAAGILERTIFDGASLLNAAALLVFVLSFRHALPGGSVLDRPLQLSGWALALTIVLGVISLCYFLAFLISGRALEPPQVLRFMAVGTFIFTYGAAMYFLLVFRGIDDYSSLFHSASAAAHRSGG